ncbi:DNA-directed DNA polymerase gamma mip1 [Hanseniaspora vineae]
MGTVTRRAVENCWLTASNAKKNRIGSELKSLIKAPEGYSFVGADVDSEELWIASLVGDSVFKTHGGTPVGWMCLEGSKSEGTDLHTKTAQILGCTRNEAKIFNYGRIYGAGVKFAAQLLKQFVPSMSDKETVDVATSLYKETKGKKITIPTVGTIWYGGSESVLFNKLEEISDQDIPQTPVLGASITNSLLKGNLKKRSFLPSRINWVIQSSGVDYLHLLCCSMNYLIEKYQIDARMVISIHDEIRFLVNNKDKYRAAMALQISNLWTRAMFCEQLGMTDLPQNCAFFSAVDIDFVLRKEVDMDCITPSNQVPLEHGETLDIYKLMSMDNSALGKPVTDIDLSKYKYEPRAKVVETLKKQLDPLLNKYLIATEVQNQKTVADALIKEYKENQLQSKLVNEYNKLLDETIDFNDPLRKIKIEQPEKETQISFEVLEKSLEHKPQKQAKTKTTRESEFLKEAALMEEPFKRRKTARTKMFKEKRHSVKQVADKKMLPEESILNEILQSSYQSALDLGSYPTTGLSTTGKMMSTKKKKKFSQYDKFIQNQKEENSHLNTLRSSNLPNPKTTTVSS